jgi:hypothetical protein
MTAIIDGTNGVTTPNVLTSSSGVALTLQSGGTTAVTIDTSQNVGIGTTSPIYKLQVVANNNALVATATAGNSTGFYSAGNGNAIGSTSFDILQGGDSTAYIYNRANASLIFATNNTSRMSINAGAPILCLSGGNTSATGTGIAFPATQSASSDANTLDDYEEGTFTPIIIGGSTAGTGTYNTQSGSYTKVGRLVSFRLQVFWSAHTGTGGLFVGSLPFTCSGIGGATIGLLNDLGLTASNYAMSDIVDGATTARFRQYPVGGGTITDVPMDSAANIVLSGTYFTS